MWSSSYTGSCSERPRSPDGSGVNREVHAPFCERPGVKLLRPTHPAVNTKMMRLHGRCPRGERLVDHVPQGHWKTITFVAALRRHGMIASLTIDGSMTGKKFLAYVERCLLPDPQAQGYRHDRQSSGAQGRRCPRGDRSARCEFRYLPKYSPDLNPIEMPFSKLKAYLRKAAERTIPRLRRRIGSFARTLNPQSFQLFQACRLCVKSTGIRSRTCQGEDDAALATNSNRGYWELDVGRLFREYA